MNHLLLLLSFISLFILITSTKNVPSKDGSLANTSSPPLADATPADATADIPTITKETEYKDQLITLQGPNKMKMNKVVATITVNEYSDGHQDFSLNPETTAKQLDSGFFGKNPKKYAWLAITKSDLEHNGVQVFPRVDSNELIKMQPAVKDKLVHYYEQFSSNHSSQTRNEMYELFSVPVLLCLLGIISVPVLCCWGTIKWFCRPVRKV